MPLDVLKIQARQKPLVFIFLGVFFIILIIWLGGKFFGGGRLFSPPPLFQWEKIEVDFDILDSQFLKEALPLEDIPPFEGTWGRDNPFLPYQI